MAVVRLQLKNNVERNGPPALLATPTPCARPPSTHGSYLLPTLPRGGPSTGVWWLQSDRLPALGLELAPTLCAPAPRHPPPIPKPGSRSPRCRIGM